MNLSIWSSGLWPLDTQSSPCWLLASSAGGQNLQALLGQVAPFIEDDSLEEGTAVKWLPPVAAAGGWVHWAGEEFGGRTSTVPTPGAISHLLGKSK